MSTLEQPAKTESPAEQAVQLLRNSQYFPIRFLSCTYDGGVLTIGGRLPSFHLKQIAQTAVLGIAGVVRIENRIEVG